MSTIAIFGAGSWGTALAQSFASYGHQVMLWARNSKQVDAMQATRLNAHYLPGIRLHENIQFLTDIEQTAGADYSLIAVPTQAQRAFLEANKARFSGCEPLINVAKGLEADSGKRLSTIYTEVLGDVEGRYVVLYGPSHAEEGGRNMPTALVAAAKDEGLAAQVQKDLMNENLRLYTTDDVAGVELGGALKNIIALAIGMTIGLGYGDNARAALMTRGLAEISRLGVKNGANPLTFLGLTGVGDLIVTCTSSHSRNRTAGVQLGEGRTLEDVLSHMGMVVEGVPTTKAAYERAQASGISMPIVEHMHAVLFDQADVKEAAFDLMTRSGKSEQEDYLN